MPDLINGLFEFLGGCAIDLSCLALWRSKKSLGVSWIHFAYFLGWGVWNLYFYPSLDQWWSFWGGVWVVRANLTYLLMLLYYRVPRPMKVVVRSQWLWDVDRDGMKG